MIYILSDSKNNIGDIISKYYYLGISYINISGTKLAKNNNVSYESKSINRQQILSTYLGVLISSDIDYDNYYFIFDKDNKYNSLAEYWQRHNYEVQIIRDISEFDIKLLGIILLGKYDNELFNSVIHVLSYVELKALNSMLDDSDSFSRLFNVILITNGYSPSLISYIDKIVDKNKDYISLFIKNRMKQIREEFKKLYLGEGEN